MNIKALTPAEKLWGVFGVTFAISGLCIALHGYVDGAEASKKDKDVSILEKQKKITELTDALSSLGKPVIGSKSLFSREQQEFLEIAIAYEAGDYEDKKIEKADIYMVASTIINRNRAGEGSLCSITSDPVQFSFNREPKKFPKTISAVKKYKGGKHKAIQEVVSRLASGDMKPMSGVMWYNNPKMSKNSWHLGKLKDQSFCGLSIGRHVFYQKNKTTECPIINITEL